MSRHYSMSVYIEGFRPSRISHIKNALCAEWTFDDWFKRDGVLTGSGESNLCGGEEESEFAERAARAVFKANKAQCSIWVTATYLEDLPQTDYHFNASDYERLISEES